MRSSLVLTINIIFFFVLSACSSFSTQEDELKGKAAIYYNHGTALLNNKEYSKALSLFLKAEKISPKNSKLHNNLGMTYYFKDHPKEAKEHLIKALEIDPSNPDARNNLASIYLSEGKDNLALEQYEIVLKDLTYETSYRTNYNIALIYLKQNKLDVAEKYLRSSLKSQEDYCPAHYQMGNIRSKQNRLKESYDSFLASSKGTCIQDIRPLFRQVDVLIKMNELDQAELKMSYIREKFTDSKHMPMINLKSKQLLRRMEENKSGRYRKSAKQNINKKNNRYNSTQF